MFFSIVTITRNNLAGLKTTAASLENQNCRDFEWIVIDGDSCDGTKGYLPSLPAISLSEPDRGIYDAMNKGIDRARGDYLIFLNAGDALAAPDVLHRLRNDIAGEDFIYGDSLEGGRTKPARPHHKIALGMPTHHQAMAYRRDRIGGLRYDIAYPIAADYKFTMVFLIQSRTARYCPYPLCIFEQGGISQTRARQGRIEQFFIREEARLCSATGNILIYLGQTAALGLRTLFPGLYWKIKQGRAA